MDRLKRLPRRTQAAGVLTAIVLACAIAAVQMVTAQAGDHWVGTWATATVGRPQAPAQPAGGGGGGRGRGGPAPAVQNLCPPNPAPATPATSRFMHFSNQTLRQIVRTSVGGSRLRVVLSNSYGTQPLVIGAAHVALREKDAAIRLDTGRKLTFSGGASFAIPPGAVALSDPVELTVPPAADLAIDLFLPGDTNSPSPLTMHSTAVQTNYVSEPGNHAGAAKLPTQATTQNWFVIHRVDVLAPASVGGIVAYGDSITDGTRSTPDTNNRWPDHLVRRMLAQTPPLQMGVMNAAIAGNRVLSDANVQAGINAQARFDQHVASQPGATHVVFMEGINDIGQARENPTPSADDVIGAHKQIISRAHARGLKIFGATLTPFYGAAYYTEVGEAKRQAVNQWIRTSSAYDAVIDFDRVTRDPADPKKFLAAYDSCDHLHPSDAGYKAMADAIDLTLFKVTQTSSATSAR
jgi:lysophospholipase L1-like esterase